MTDMIERVARAIVDTWAAGAVGVEGGGWDAQDDFGKDAARKCARTAIAAMREPTDEMLDAGSAAHPAGGYVRETLLTDIIEAEWRAMVDAALECSTKFEVK